MQYSAKNSNLGRESSVAASFDGDNAELSRTHKKEQKSQMKANIVVQHTDIIKDDFWEQRPWLLHGHLES